MALHVEGVCPLLEVFDMPRSLRFYRDTLGFEVTQDSGGGDESGWVLLRLGEASLMLNTAYDDGERPAVPDRAREAAHRDTALYFGCPDVDGAYAHLRARGVVAEPPAVAPYGMKQLYFLDPDGYSLCFQWPAR